MSNQMTRVTALRKTFWVAVYEGSAGFAAVNRLNGQWIVRIPRGALRMRTVYTVVQQQPQPKSRVTTRNPHSIFIGLVMEDRQIARHVQQALPHWVSILAGYYSLTWLLCQYEYHPSRNITPHLTLALDRVLNQGTPRWLSGIRHQLEQLYPDIYEATSGWRRYPTLSDAVHRWTEALSYTRRDAKIMAKRYLTEHWEALRRYWNLTCKRSTEAIATANEGDICARINAEITERREIHARRPGAQVDTALDLRSTSLQTASTKWHSSRRAALHLTSTEVDTD